MLPLSSWVADDRLMMYFTLSGETLNVINYISILVCVVDGVSDLYRGSMSAYCHRLTDQSLNMYTNVQQII
jgi:hypothetical protein